MMVVIFDERGWLRVLLTCLADIGRQLSRYAIRAINWKDSAEDAVSMSLLWLSLTTTGRWVL